MSSLTAVKAAIDLVNWESVGYSRIKTKMDELLESIDSDINESEMDESSESEKLYGQLRKLLDEEEVLAAETFDDSDDEDELEVELEDEDDEDDDDDNDEDDDEVEVVDDVVNPIAPGQT